MRKLLHIVASPRAEDSRTLQVSDVFLEAFKENHPDWVVDVLDLYTEDLPELSAKSISGKYALLDGKELFGSLRESWLEIVQHIERFKSSDYFLISSPMWNFSIPYKLKQYIDLIVQPKYLFRYTKSGVEGLVKGKKMILISSRGGEYSMEGQELDFQAPYLKAIFRFVGIEDFTSILVEPMDRDELLRKERIEEAQVKARSLAQEI